MKQLRKSSIFILLPMLLACAGPAALWGQVSVWDKARITGKSSFNYSPDADFIPSTRKDYTNRLVYSDRSGNQAFDDPYFQRKREQQSIGTPYYIIGEENGTYELVKAEPDMFGKPKTFFSFLLDKKRHFKTPDKVNYAGWIPRDNVLLFNHAYMDEKNNRPIKYRVGVSDISRLFDASRYFRGDTLSVYGEPFLKKQLAGGLLNGQIIYAYKYDKAKRAVLVSDAPSLDDASRKVLGWVPANLVAEVGQSHAFLVGSNCLSDSIYGIRRDGDTFHIHEDNLQSRILFDFAGNTLRRDDASMQQSTEINVPVSVWDPSRSNLINVKGGDVIASDIKRMEKEGRQVNIHLLFFDSDRKQANIFCNALQNFKLKLSPTQNYAFTATSISLAGNRYSGTTTDFAQWLDFIADASLHRTAPPKGENAGLNAAIQRILNDVKEPVFDHNLFIILGSKQALDIKDEQITKLAHKSGCLLFVQTNRSSDTAYQDFILQAKSLLSSHSTAYIDFITNYIVDNKLVKPELFRNVETEDANVYLFDAPANSLSIGGVIFPRWRDPLQNTSLELALDSMNSQVQTLNHTLLNSLKSYQMRVGTLRSRPTHDLEEIFIRSEMTNPLHLSAINRNSVSDTYFFPLSIPDSVLNNYENGYILNETELEDLLQDYRSLLPEFADSIRKKEFRTFRKVLKIQRKSLNREFHRKVLKKKTPIAQLFYYKTSVPANEELFQHLKVRHLRTRKSRKNNFHATYASLIDKLKALEGMYMEHSFETVTVAGETYYFIPKPLLP